MSHRIAGLVFGMFVVMAIPIALARPQGDSASIPLGATVTLLSDGRWLIVGGEGASGAIQATRIWDSANRTMTALAEALAKRARGIPPP
jgi:hypothetical protein